jgi:hypothetical protein
VIPLSGCVTIRERLAVSKQRSTEFIWRGSISRNETKQVVKSSIMLKFQIGSQLWNT